MKVDGGQNIGFWSEPLTCNFCIFGWGVCQTRSSCDVFMATKPKTSLLTYLITGGMQNQCLAISHDFGKRFLKDYGPAV